MPLFHRQRTQADRIGRQRARLAGGEDLDAPLLDLLRELDLPAEAMEDGWTVDFGPFALGLIGYPREPAVVGLMPVGGFTAPEGMRAALHGNLEHAFGYLAGGDPGEVDARMRIPAGPFDREGVVQGLQGLAELLDALLEDDLSELVERLRAARSHATDRDLARTRATQALELALGELEIPAEPREDGIWAIETERGVVDAILADTGASWMLMHHLRFEDGDQNPEILRWLLESSGRRGARLGLADLPDGPNLFAALVLPAGQLNTCKVAYGLEEMLRLSDQMDRQNGFL